MKYKLDILTFRNSITVKKEDLLADKIQESGINLSVYCNKKGICGKCFVQILQGYLPPLKPTEKLLLNRKSLDENYRLACQYRIQGSLKIKIPPESIFQEASILTTGMEIPVSVRPSVKKYYLQLKKPRSSSPHSLLDLICKYIGKKSLKVRPDVLRNIPSLLERSKYKVTATLYRDNELLSLEANDTTSLKYGIAVDIGTSTVVTELVDLNTGEILDNLTEANSQAKYGSDVISRIGYSLSKENNLKELKKTIIHTLNQMIDNLLSLNRLKKGHVYEIVIAGNPTMNHLLLGIPVKSLASSPFNSVFSLLAPISAGEIGLPINKNGKVYIIPNIKSFVGGDITAGLAASDLCRKKGNYLFVDLGTNGEIVLKTDQKILATSTAAGPAFEGMNISCGMLALPGAIYKAEYDQGIKVHTLNNNPPVGICGTGLIDLMAIFLEKKIMSLKGHIKNHQKKISISESVYISQKDIRELQLAVAAIKTGINMILEKNNLTPQQLDGIYIGGAFGNYLNIKNSMKIGLLPEMEEEKIVFIGNSSLAGAKCLLVSEPTREKIEAVIKNIRYFSLASQSSFQKKFLSSLSFK